MNIKHNIWWLFEAYEFVTTKSLAQYIDLFVIC